MPDRPRVLLTESLAEEPTRWLAERADVHALAPGDTSFDTLATTAQGLIVRTYTTVDDDLLDRAPDLRVVGRAGVGYDNIDVAACRRRGVEVVYTPGANTQAVVEFVTARIMEHMRSETPLREALDAATWITRREKVSGRQLDGLTLGLLGLGRIGRRVARVAAAFGTHVIFHDLLDISPATREGAQPVAPEDVFRDADIVSVHVDGRPSNRSYVGSRLIDLMKPDVLFLNTSRGFVVDILAMAAFLDRCPAATAVLDVHENEPFDETYPLLACSNARLYPHVASRTRQAMTAMSWVVRDVMAVLEGRRPEHAVPAIVTAT